MNLLCLLIYSSYFGTVLFSTHKPTFSPYHFYVEIADCKQTVNITFHFGEYE